MLSVQRWNGYRWEILEVIYGKKSYGKQRKLASVKQAQPFILGIVGVTL